MDDPWLYTDIQVYKPNPHAMRFSHWTTSTLAPGGGQEVTKED